MIDGPQYYQRDYLKTYNKFGGGGAPIKVMMQFNH